MSNFTDQMYIGLRNGRCVAIAWKLTDSNENARTVSRWTRDGLDVLTVHESESDPYYEQMRSAVLADMQKSPRLL